ncbi:alkaline phosphatase [Chitinophaga horti]|uniref:Alkaline phosphatase n=1 Tax=Chitinophaga horti TaxID=2920382 RepID=A0ABY6J975_9BACT|nr:alkaline phosphatase [Chitinophaga horti]UYQ95881.1 alkaline phosphatase [Chitinophaga horti]
MRRRDFFRNGMIGVLGTPLIAPFRSIAQPGRFEINGKSQAKNIIFMVSDGMSTGTLAMADMLRLRMDGRRSHWMSLYEQGKATRALMETASSSSLVTDSAAASSSWGGGARVPNGSLNVGANGEIYTPILQKFKAAGKATGCVTTVPITHATPAGFCVNMRSRGDQEDIALAYLPLKFDVMLGGGDAYFNGSKRKDKKDVYADFRNAGYEVVNTRTQLNSVSPGNTKPLLGVFAEDGLPYTLDAKQTKEDVPTLAEMTTHAINALNRNKKGFVLQVEGGKVDWGAHSNDAGAMLYDQVAFDDAIAAAIAFAEKDGNTLVVITTDHGNSNPGLFYSSKANAGFDRLQKFKYTNEWILKGLTNTSTAAQVIERIEAAQGYAITHDEAAELVKHYQQHNEDGVYNKAKLPYRPLAQIQTNYISIGWGSMDHSADHVELAMFGPGSAQLKPFVKNYELHNFMLNVTGVVRK